MFTLTCWPLLAVGSGSAGDEQKGQQVDQYGDPLPTGAIARLGTVRLRHGRPIRQLAFSRDNKRLITVGKQIRMWEVASGKELAAADWLPHSWYLALSPDGETLASADYLGPGITVWNTSSGAKVHHFGINPKVTSWGGVAISPDGKVLAGGFVDCTILWDLGTGISIGSIIPGAPQCVVATSAQGEMLAIHSDNAVVIWQVLTGKKLSEFFQSAVWTMVFCPRGKLIATGNFGNDVRLINVATGKEVRCLIGDWHTNVLAFSHDARIIAAGSREGAVTLWNAETGERLHRFDDYQAEAHALAFSHDNKMLATGHADGVVRLWNLATGKQIHATAGHRADVSAIVLSSDAKTLYATGPDGLVGVWDLATARKRHDFASGRRFGGRLALAPDGEGLAVVEGPPAKFDTSLTLWDLHAAKKLWSGPEHWTLSFAFTPDGKVIAAGMSSNRIVLRNARDGELQVEIDFESPSGVSWVGGSTRFVEISPDGKLLAAAGLSGIRVWQLESRKHLYFLSPDGKLEDRTVAGIAFSPDGRLLASVEKEGIHLWEIATGQHVAVIPDREWRTCVVRFSADGRFLATGNTDGEVIVFEVGQEKPVATFKGHRGAISSLAFFPDNQRLASGAADTTILIWELREIRSRPTAILRLTAKELEQAWHDLDSADAALAFEASGRLACDPGQSLPFLEARLTPAPRLGSGRFEPLIARLDSAQFVVRDGADQELEKVGEAVLPGLRRVLASNPPFETRMRVERLLARIDVGFLPPAELLRPLRALAVLERIGTPRAWKVLQSLSRGAPEARVTVEATKSLARLRAEN